MAEAAADTRLSSAAVVWGQELTDAQALTALDRHIEARHVTSNYTAQCSHVDHMADDAGTFEWAIRIPTGERWVGIPRLA